MHSEDNLADELKLREHSKYHSGLTSVAHKNNRDVCWVCFEPVGNNYVDIPMKSAWIRLCDNRACEKVALKEPMGDTDSTQEIRSVVPTQVAPLNFGRDEQAIKQAAKSLPDFARRKRG